MQKALNQASAADVTDASAMADACSASSASLSASKAIKNAFPSESLAALLKAVHGRTQTKILLIESLRGEFNGVARNAIEAAVDQYTEREGKKATSKWVVKTEFKHLLL